MPARPRVLAASLIAIAIVAALPAPAPLAQSTGFTLAVLRRDGVIIPFASFEGNRWVNRWPAEQAMEVPIGLGDVPKEWWPNRTITLEWKAWPLSAVALPIKVVAPTMVKVHCARRVALRTDYVSVEPPPPPEVQPYPKNGLAVAGNAVVEAIQLVPQVSPVAAALVEHVRNEVLEAESKRAREWKQVWEHPMNEKGRAAVPLTLELLARTPGLETGSSVYYFEGVKKYPGFYQYPPAQLVVPGRLPTREMCEFITFAGGWFFDLGKPGASKASAGAELTNCNREGVAYTLPLGALRVAGRLFWVVQTSGWNFERYDVIEIKSKEVKVALSVGGGGC